MNIPKEAEEANPGIERLSSAAMTDERNKPTFQERKRKNSSNNMAKDNNLDKKRISEVEYLNIQDDELDSDSIIAAANLNNGQMLVKSVSTNSGFVEAQNKQLPPASTGFAAANANNSNQLSREPRVLEQPKSDGRSSGNGRGASQINKKPTTRTSQEASITTSTATNGDNVINNVGTSGGGHDDDDEESLNSYHNQPRTRYLTKNLLWAILASTVGASFQHGYHMGVVNAPENLLGQFVNDTYHSRHKTLPSPEQVDLIFSTIVSIYCIGGCIGALLTAFVASRIGRKEGLFYNNILVLIACPIMASSKALQSYELLILGRLIIGLNAGLNAGLAPLYLNEISPTNLRGALGTIYQLVITISIFLSNIFGLPNLLGTQDLWPLLFAIPLFPAAFMLIALPHCCESPKHLLLNMGQELKAQQALAWFRETGEIQDEMDDLRSENEFQKQSPKITLGELWKQRSLRKALTISIVIMLSQQFSGINAVLYYSTSIFRDTGLSQLAALRATMGMSLTNVLMTIVSLFLVDRAGRKTLHMTGLMGMAVTCLILALCLGGSSEAPTNETTSLIAVISIYLFIVMFASGPGSIPWFLVSELFPSNSRPLASSIAVSINWLANFVVLQCFLPVSNILHGFTFFIFAALSIFFFLFTYYKVPETKGATAEEISALFAR